LRDVSQKLEGHLKLYIYPLSSILKEHNVPLAKYASFVRRRDWWHILHESWSI